MLSWETNEIIIQFVLNNIVLLYIIEKILTYICKKTPWAFDDDLPSFFSGLIDTIKKGRK